MTDEELRIAMKPFADAAFPLVVVGPQGLTSCTKGLSKREYFAGLAMQAIVQEHKIATRIGHQIDEIGSMQKAAAIMAVECADALIKELSK